MHASTSVERIGDMRCGVGESPVWHAGEAALYWTDITGRALWRWESETNRAHAWALPEMAGSIAMIADGGIALAMQTGVYRVPRPAPGAPLPEPVLLAGVAHAADGMRFNDGRCDRQGRFWAGTMACDTSLARASGRLYRLDSNARALAAECDALIVPNGLAFSPDGRTMYLSDSHPTRRIVWAFDYDVDAGRPHGRRVFVDMNAHAGRPDGAAVDEDGCYWICGIDSGYVHRFTPDGRLDRSIAVPVAKPSMCAFGGARCDTLFVTSIRTDDDPLSGATFALDPRARGLPEPAMRL
ncbi:SMP-30/gluconolactonase/LRE family protein [Burkholderia oklahomensis]|uniref:SMP-30/Gluconolaconase/LRE-like region family protein n=1 Tax=Burkholderia oklahomensis TaxID=342113 RepID=A0AAI8FMN6_9BURK|nr:SMP-30/gluconolactonase/LRE family protein [Burkholderia oklahomensis]AIO66000.1 SMP-30/Gluconolaconase/LRE-like region family protein [Burkholderia oklahomensis]AOI43888.1 gluconolactonase [Burkholderia oklahomensis EO147]KUY49529.1 gluconolactonase [Burkholderia oklahomensis EO147]QPS38649.1 SMP-30/gluconolactonase/LRE family protein [Burkholderia oklahomensis]